MAGKRLLLRPWADEDPAGRTHLASGQCRGYLGPTATKERAMNEDIFNMDTRKFLKRIGVASQREIEKAVDTAIASGRIKGDETLNARMTLAIERVGLECTVDGKIALG